MPSQIHKLLPSARRWQVAPLVAGHVIAVEPKVFLGGIGAVGVENTYVITETGCRDVTPGPEEIRVLPPGGGA